MTLAASKQVLLHMPTMTPRREPRCKANTWIKVSRITVQLEWRIHATLATCRSTLAHILDCDTTLNSLNISSRESKDVIEFRRIDYQRHWQVKWKECLNATCLTLNHANATQCNVWPQRTAQLKWRIHIIADMSHTKSLARLNATYSLSWVFVTLLI
jgi:hypothetical protein